jgi:hypothetical protein
MEKCRSWKSKHLKLFLVIRSWGLKQSEVILEEID